MTFASPTFPWGIHKYYFKKKIFYNAAQRKETEYLNNCAFTKSTNAGQTQAEKSLMHWLSMKEKGQMKTAKGLFTVKGEEMIISPFCPSH